MIIVLLLAKILDIYFNYLIPLLPEVFKFLIPQFFISISIIYIMLNHKIKELFFIIFLDSLIFEKNNFLNIIIMFIIYLIFNFISKKVNYSKITYTFIFTCLFILYFIIKYGLLIITTDYIYEIDYIFNIIIHSLILNIILSFIFYMKLGIKYKKS